MRGLESMGLIRVQNLSLRPCPWGVCAPHPPRSGSCPLLQGHCPPLVSSASNCPPDFLLCPLQSFFSTADRSTPSKCQPAHCSSLQIPPAALFARTQKKARFCSEPQGSEPPAASPAPLSLGSVLPGLLLNVFAKVGSRTKEVKDQCPKPLKGRLNLPQSQGQDNRNLPGFQ